MPTLQIDGRKVQVPEGASVLAAVRAAGVRVPTLCHHEAVEAWGGCRLCVVDVARPGREPRMVTACLFPAEDGLVVRTATPRVVATRRVVIDLLLARCPETPLVQELAREHGLESTSYEVNPEPTDCVLCGLCTRVCEKVGVSAIASVSRGTTRVIGTPFDAPPPDCIGCLACAEICPTGHIHASESAGSRRIWGRVFEMQRCTKCGASVVTLAQVEWAKKHGLAGRDYELCDACKRAELARTFAGLRGDAGNIEAAALVE
jgi:NADH dehydrogenase/NADH:ubiquinone oxidoreductase subunit G